MLKKRFILPVAAALLLLLVSNAALAADYDITGTTGTLSIPAGAHTISGTSANLAITCAQGVSLTLNGVSVTSTGGCALKFTGAGNALILAPGTTNSFSSGTDCPGISVASGVVLTISGSGTVTATGGMGGAGIGSGSFGNGGTISISGGTIHATGGLSSSGIGGGYMGSGGNTSISGGTVTATGSAGAAGIGGNINGGTINISGGTVTATSNGYAAGIGGGSENGDGGTIGISGGTVTAAGGLYGAGIGGGYNGDGGAIGISGGTVTATGGLYGAGVGGGVYGDGGTISISGGKVYAARSSGDTGAQDIGHGQLATNTIFTLSASAAVFLENDSYAVPTILGLQAHYSPVPFVGNTANGITVPASWTTAQGAFLPPYVPQPAAVSVPQTGDGSRMGLRIALAGVTGAALSLVLVLRRRRRA